MKSNILLALIAPTYPIDETIITQIDEQISKFPTSDKILSLNRELIFILISSVRDAWLSVYETNEIT